MIEDGKLTVSPDDLGNEHYAQLQKLLSEVNSAYIGTQKAIHLYGKRNNK